MLDFYTTGHEHLVNWTSTCLNFDKQLLQLMKHTLHLLLSVDKIGLNHNSIYDPKTLIGSRKDFAI